MTSQKKLIPKFETSTDAMEFIARAINKQYWFEIREVGPEVDVTIYYMNQGTPFIAVSGDSLFETLKKAYTIFWERL